MVELIPFFIVLFAGLFFSELFLRFHFPWVLALILGGITIGPSGLGFFEVNETLEFFGQIGLLFLMFMAGLETKLLEKGAGKRFKSIGSLAFFNSAIPFATGFGIGYYFGFSLEISILLGIIFISSSIAIIVPTLEAKGLLKCKLGTSIVSSTIVADILSLLLLSFLLQSSTMEGYPSILLYLVLLIVLIALRYVIPMIELFFAKEGKTAKDIFQQELRSILVLLVGTVIIFEVLGLHPIIAGFFAGVALSQSVTSVILKEKLRGISYGIFIPIFFVVIGAQTNIGLISDQYLVFTAVLIVGTVISKLVSGYVGGRLNRFTKNESLIIGSATVPQLSTTLAVAFSASGLGLIEDSLMTSLVILSLVTTFISPILINIFTKTCDFGKGAVCFKPHEKEQYYG